MPTSAYLNIYSESLRTDCFRLVRIFLLLLLFPLDSEFGMFLEGGKQERGNK